MTTLLELFFQLNKTMQLMVVVVSLTAVFISLMCVTSLHPVFSLFLLITLYVLTAIILFFLSIDFLALLYMIIYVGAVAVLFLFVVMMLNIRTISFVSLFKKFPFFYFFLYSMFVVLFMMVFNFTNISYFSAYQKAKDVDPLSVEVPSLNLEIDPTALSNNFSKLTSKSFSFFGLGNDIYLIGSKLYTTLQTVFIILSFLLFLALIVAIIITDVIRYSDLNKENYSKNLDNFDNTKTEIKFSPAFEEIINEPINVKNVVLKDGKYLFDYPWLEVLSFMFIVDFILYWKLYFIWFYVIIAPLGYFWLIFGNLILFDLFLNWNLVIFVFEEYEKYDDKRIKNGLIYFFEIYSILLIFFISALSFWLIFGKILFVFLFFFFVDLLLNWELVTFMLEKSNKSFTDELDTDK